MKKVVLIFKLNILCQSNIIFTHHNNKLQVKFTCNYMTSKRSLFPDESHLIYLGDLASSARPMMSYDIQIQ